MKNNRHLLFLLEVILDLLIFSVSAVVCVGLLVRAYDMSRKSTVLTDAVYLAQSAAETWRAGGVPERQTDDYVVEIKELAREDSVSVTVLQGGKKIYTIDEVVRP